MNLSFTSLPSSALTGSDDEKGLRLASLTIPWPVLLLLFYLLLYMLPLNNMYLWEPDETRYSEISREMVSSGDWIVPRFLGLRYFEKPIAGYWVNSLSQMLWGDSNFSVRFGSAFSTGVSIFLVYHLAWLLWRRRPAAFNAALIYMTLGLVAGVGTFSVLDPMLTMWMTMSMWAYYLSLRARGPKGKAGAYALLGLACGMGFLTKGFLALALPVISALPVAINGKKFKDLLLYGPVAVLCAALLSLPWCLAIAGREADFWNYFFWVEHIQRFAMENAQHDQPFWFYIPVFIGLSLPWLGLLPGGLLLGVKQRRRQPELFFLLSWLLMPFIFFSAANGKLITYILPCMAPLALLLAARAEQCQSENNYKPFKINGAIMAALGLLGFFAPLVVTSDFWLGEVLYQPAQEWPKLVLIEALCLGLLLIGALSWRRASRYWRLAALCPLLVLNLAAFILPQAIIDRKQPQRCIQEYKEELAQVANLAVIAPELGAALAWELKRTDIQLLNQQGELRYGLTYPDSHDRFSPDRSIARWLRIARSKGDVVIMTDRAPQEALPSSLSLPARIERCGSYYLLFYPALSRPGN
jgi:4-amino-4-deoxy-L-arabinose transferase